MMTFLNWVKQNAPAYAPALEDPSFTPNFFSGNCITIPESAVTQAKSVISAIEKIRNTPRFLDGVNARHPQIPNTKHRAAFSAYDFYLNDSGLHLIEINTNAAAATLVSLINSYWGAPADRQSITAYEAGFQRMMTTEIRRSGIPIAGDRPLHLAICDAFPTTQPTRFDYRLVAAMCEKVGWTISIEDVADLRWEARALTGQRGTPIDGVINRFCDFYLQTPAAAPLREANASQYVLVTPNSWEYATLADKANLITFSEPSTLETFGVDATTIDMLKRHIPRTLALTPETADSLWSDRRNLFFKPASSYGSKGGFKGKSITKTVFAQLLESKSAIAQTYVTAGLVTELPHSEIQEPFKFDLRFYVYESEILVIGARQFMGQTMNFQSLGGGFAGVRIL